jgi:hypothetical protein
MMWEAYRNFKQDMVVKADFGKGKGLERVVINAHDIQYLRMKLHEKSGGEIKVFKQRALWYAFRVDTEERWYQPQLMTGELYIQARRQDGRMQFRVCRLFHGTYLFGKWRCLETEAVLLHSDAIFLLHGLRASHNCEWTPTPRNFAREIVKDHVGRYLPPCIVGIVWLYLSPMEVQRRRHKRKRVVCHMKEQDVGSYATQ